ncbi:heme NO-binding domain-containing protein [uncultured Roseobacter sp.]|uniref:heme NO-binding domain-containing protein n=1 Tax=uncultured Roseobacter sp. TaxID=114847 RepID=UPI002621086C|nr:heme NO-binding domain-containing protein [uncultured Roseobacter sp.]
MHGLVNKAIQSFVIDNYGATQWSAVVRVAHPGCTEFEAMWTYEDAITPRLLEASSDVLDRPYPELMEDIGAYLVSHPNLEPLRRLMRFGGMDFEDFLYSLDDLPDRARLAVADLELPRLDLRELGEGRYVLSCEGKIDGSGHLFLGLLRAMADDYGALVTLDHQGVQNGVEQVSITLLEAAFAEGREFELGVRA